MDKSGEQLKSWLSKMKESFELDQTLLNSANKSLSSLEKKYKDAKIYEESMEKEKENMQE